MLCLPLVPLARATSGEAGCSPFFSLLVFFWGGIDAVVEACGQTGREENA